MSDSAIADKAAAFWKHGYVVLRSVFRESEMELVRRAITTHPEMTRRYREVQAKYLSGKYPSFETIVVWNDTSARDIFAKATRRQDIMSVLEGIFDDRVHVYHNKVTVKYPNMPGFKYHQDYNYWYHMGCLYPDLATAFIAVDATDEENGCLKVIDGSHRLGRIDHKYVDGVSDSGVDPERLEFILERLPERPLPLAVGDVAIFHCNTLHGADANRSERSRLALLGCYNTRHNDPVKRGIHPNYRDQEMV